MEGKLIKRDNDFYSLIVDGLVMATSNGMIVDYKLSLKNCEAIANGYDLDELSKITFPSLENCGVYLWMSETDRNRQRSAFITGFQKALEILGDKKYNEYVKFMFQFGFNLDNPMSRNEYDAHIQSLQQTEFDVEILMGTNYRDIDYVNEGELVNSKIVKDGEAPMLDKDGCLILKRI